MKTLQVTKQFKKDVNRLKKKRKDFNKLKLVIDAICEGKAIEEKHRDHKLIGNYGKAREYHIEPDWLLIYRIDEDEKELILVRSGSHAELF